MALTREELDEKSQRPLAELGCQNSSDIDSLFIEFQESIRTAASKLIAAGAPNEAERTKIRKEFRDWMLGRKNGLVARIDEHWLKPVPKDWKRDVGVHFNGFRRFADHTVEWVQNTLRVNLGATAATPAGVVHVQDPDLTLPGLRRPLGSIHPVTRVQREIEDIFLGLGFKIETGPEIESVYYNFDALNIPETHASRDDWDTIYVDSKTLLRTHTSPVQIRGMEKWVSEGSDGGLYIITPGKCYRNDNPDATHSPMFHQMEGLAIDTDITFADLKGTLDYFAKKFFGDKTRTSFTPTFFPFTEPSGEVAVSCYVCGGVGCRTCKESGWIELMGCGMVHPQVLKNGGIDAGRYSGWAFGLGIDRFAMARYGVNDIQLFFQGDVRFLEQF